MPSIPPDALEGFGAAFASAIADRIARVVAERMPAAPAPCTPASPLVDVDGLASALGVSAVTVRRMVRRGCPVEWYGKSPRFDVAAVRAWARDRGPHSVTPERKAPAVPSGPIPGVELKTRKRRG
ncbi:hypothetical protein [Sorangium sp. So ce693]|uniref:hypothetical protein n=1 Tax=Sorangium sp. So ce693 TaxID=3133318 RepID=UPI003F5D75DD